MMCTVVYPLGYRNKFVTSISRSIKSDIYCSGIQILNPYKINKITKPIQDFNLLWKKLISMKKLFVSDIRPKKWFTVDNLKQLKRLRKFKNLYG